jgi:hypothetical protein
VYHETFCVIYNLCVCVAGCVDGRMNGCFVGWMDGWMGNESINSGSDSPFIQGSCKYCKGNAM